MTSRTNPISDDQLTTAIRSAFDDIVVATERYDAHIHAARSNGSPEMPTPDGVVSSIGVLHDPAIPVGGIRHRSDRSRWLLSAAAVVILIAGIGALTTLDNRSPEPEVPASSPSGSTLSSGAEASDYRYVEPLAVNMVPFLDPAPAEPDAVNRPRSFEWVRGITGFSLFAVRQDEQPAIAVTVLETAIPWDVISEGLPIETIGGAEAVVVRTPDETGLFIKNGSTTRAVFDTAITAGNEEAPADVSSEAREVGELIAGQSLDAVTGSNRVVQITPVGAGSTTVRYGSDTEAETILFRTTIPVSLNDDDVPLAAELMSAMLLPDTPEGLAFERVSPTDLIVVAAANQDRADDALAAVQFDERPSTSNPDQEPIYDQVVARGEPSWGRWELAARSDDPTCWKAATTIWGPSNTGDEARSCTDAGATGAVPAAFCLYMDDRIVGASLDRDAVFDFQSQSDPDGFDAAVEQTGDTVSFQVRDTNDRADRLQVDITVDGAPLTCTI